MSANRPTDRDRIEALILYISERCAHDPKFSKTKLNKLLFYADSVALGVLGRPITEWRYVKDRYGPVPEDYSLILRDMVEARRLKIERDQAVEAQQVPVARVPVPGDLLTPAQTRLVDQVIDIYWEHGAGAISDESHADVPGWEVIARGHPVPLRPRLLRPRVPDATRSKVIAAIDFLMRKNREVMRRLA